MDIAYGCDWIVKILPSNLTFWSSITDSLPRNFVRYVVSALSLAFSNKPRLGKYGLHLQMWLDFKNSALQFDVPIGYYRSQKISFAWFQKGKSWSDPDALEIPAICVTKISKILSNTLKFVLFPSHCSHKQFLHHQNRNHHRKPSLHTGFQPQSLQYTAITIPLW